MSAPHPLMPQVHNNNLLDSWGMVEKTSVAISLFAATRVAWAVFVQVALHGQPVSRMHLGGRRNESGKSLFLRKPEVAVEPPSMPVEAAHVALELAGSSTGPPRLKTAGNSSETPETPGRYFMNEIEEWEVECLSAEGEAEAAKLWHKYNSVRFFDTEHRDHFYVKQIEWDRAAKSYMLVCRQEGTFDDDGLIPFRVDQDLHRMIAAEDHSDAPYQLLPRTANDSPIINC